MLYFFRYTDKNIDVVEGQWVTFADFYDQYDLTQYGIYGKVFVNTMHPQAGNLKKGDEVWYKNTKWERAT